MAFWTWKEAKGRKYRVVYTRKAGKQAQVPRRLYKHLDGAPDHNMKTWVRQWAAQNEQAKVTPDHILFSDDDLNKRLDEWHTYFHKHLGRDQETADHYRSYIRRYAIPYFLEKGLKDPGQWPGVSVKLFDYLCKYECSQALIAEVNNALRAFFRWLQEEGLVAWEGDLRLRNTRKGSKKTTLTYALRPEEVLCFVRDAVDWQIQLLALAGYFLSLRPQETLALAPEDFAAGDEVRGLECSAAMRAAGLYDLLAVHVQRQRSRRVEAKPPKAHSVGWVACFDREAAEMLVAIVNDRPDGRMLPQDIRGLYRRWEASTRGTPLEDIDLKDLRRASIYWLGHHTPMQAQPLHLMKHARHKEFETTQLYLRRPEEQKPKGRTRLKLGA